MLRAAFGVALTVLIAAPAGAQTFATYTCADGTVIPVEFFNTPRSASAQIDGKSVILPRKMVSVRQGVRYAKGGVALYIARDGLSLKRKGQRRVGCKAG